MSSWILATAASRPAFVVLVMCRYIGGFCDAVSNDDWAEKTHGSDSLLRSPCSCWDSSCHASLCLEKGQRYV